MASFDIDITGLDAALGLFRDIEMQFDGDTVYVVGPTVEYAVHVERGTSNRPARPFVRPAAERVQQDPGLAAAFLDTGVIDGGEDEVVKATALAVQREIQRIITRKDLIDTGTMRASITINEQ
jgi:hypothetical protein